MGSTNYFNTFIAVAPDCQADQGVVLPDQANPSVAAQTFDLIDGNSYQLTSDDVIFTVHADCNGIASPDRDDAREQFFAQDQACLRASDLGKRYGWGIHSDGQGRVALYSVDSDTYAALENGEDPEDPDVTVTNVAAMRSSRKS